MNVMMQMISSMVQTQQPNLQFGTNSLDFKMLLSEMQSVIPEQTQRTANTEVDETIVDYALLMGLSIPQTTLLEGIPMDNNIPLVEVELAGIPREYQSVHDLVESADSNLIPIASRITVDKQEHWSVPLQVQPEILIEQTAELNTMLDFQQAKEHLCSQEQYRPKAIVESEAEVSQFLQQLQFEPRAIAPQVERTFPIRANQIVQQFEQALGTQLKAKQDEFVIKLKPEGIGELVVKITNADGKTSLLLAASNKEVTTLMQQHVQELKQVLASHQVDYLQVETMTEFQSNHQDQTFKGKPKFYQMVFEQEEATDQPLSIYYDDGHTVAYV